MPARDRKKATEKRPKYSPELPWLATLTRGNVYVLGGRTFEKGVPLAVDDAQRAHLEEHGGDTRIHSIDHLDPEADEAGRLLHWVPWFEFVANPDFKEPA